MTSDDDDDDDDDDDEDNDKVIAVRGFVRHSSGFHAEKTNELEL